MAHWKVHPSPPSHYSIDKPLPAPPPSPASSLARSTSSRARSSSMRISRLPSFTSTLSSDQCLPHDVLPPLPVSVIVHGEFQHELVVRQEHPLVHTRTDSFPLYPQEQAVQLLSPLPDDKDSVYPSPTLSTFSSPYSRETSFTTPNTSYPASPTSCISVPSLCSPENIALPASPVDDRGFFREPISSVRRDRAPSSPVPKAAFPAPPILTSIAVSPPTTNVYPASPASSYFPPCNADDAAAQSTRLRAPNSAEHPQSRWSVATTASLTPSTVEPSLSPRTPSKERKEKWLKTPKKRTRFINLISRLSPGRTETSSTAKEGRTGDDVEYDSANDSDTEDYKQKRKPRKSLSKKSSLASLRASLSLSRASINSLRPPISSPIEEVPPLPTSPTRTSPNASRPCPTDSAIIWEVVPPVPKLSLSRISSRALLNSNPLPPIPQSASTITSFRSSSQVSVCDTSATSPSGSRVSLLSPATSQSASQVSLLPSPSKRTSLASAAGIEPAASISPVSANATLSTSKSIFRLTTKPKNPRTSTTPKTQPKATPSRLPVTGIPFLSSPTPTRSRIPQAPTKFTPPAKLASVIATESQRATALASLAPAPPTSKLPTPPSRASSKVPRSATTALRPSIDTFSSPLPSSRLPMPASAKGARVGTVKGFWRRQ